MTEDGKPGTKMLESPVVNYTAGSGVKNYKWAFTTPRALANAALVLTFGDGASVQIDNVSMIGNSQAEVADENPVNAATQWNANGADGGAATDAGIENGVHKFTGIKSGSTWYSPQITSAQFKTLAGAKYKMTAKLKLVGTSNNIVSYIVQNQGSWEVVQDVVDINLTTLGVPDEDGVLGEVAKAFIVKAKASDITFDDIKEQLNGELESYKLPVYYEWTDKIPKTQNGKIQRGLLK